MDKNLIPIKLDSTRCVGCNDCVKRCPTEAIRVRNRKAWIIADRCIVCGECVRVCNHYANELEVDPFTVLDNYKYTVALVDPVLYSEYSGLRNRNDALTALKAIGFSDAFEMAEAAEAISDRTRRALESGELEAPVISSSCPVVRKLILARFPSLLNNLLPYHSPMELGARVARQRAVKKTRLKPEEVGIIYLSPCPARAAEAKDPLSTDHSEVDAVISIAELYTKLRNAIRKVTEPEILATATSVGVGWGITGGEAAAIGTDNYLISDGMENIISVLEAIEDEKLKGIAFYELSACTGGCVGGAMTAENSYIARARLNRVMKHQTPLAEPEVKIEDELIPWDHRIFYEPSIKLSGDIAQAMAKLKKVQEQETRLPGMNCGACGAPTCHALAEDIAEGKANEDQCIFLLREKMQRLLNSHKISLDIGKEAEDDDRT